VLAELEDEGFIERRNRNGVRLRDLDLEAVKALGNKVEIIVFVRQRPAPDARKCKPRGRHKQTTLSMGATAIGVPKAQISLFRRFLNLAPEKGSEFLTTFSTASDRKVAITDLAAELREVLRDYAEAEKVASETARERLKVALERTPPEIIFERKASERCQPTAAARVASVQEGRGSLAAEGPAAEMDGENRTPNAGAEAALDNAPEPCENPFPTVCDTLRKYDTTMSDADVHRFLSEAQQSRPGIAPELLCKAIEHQAKTIGPGIRSPYVT
jgi:hypothetical protein